MIKKVKASLSEKILPFLNQKCALKGPELVQYAQHVNPNTTSTFPTNPQIWFLDLGT